MFAVIAAAADSTSQSNGMTVTMDVGSLLWAVVVLVLLLAYRKNLGDFFTGIASRVSKLEFAGFSVEVSQVKEFIPQWSDTASAIDLRKKAESVEINDSTARSFLSQLKNPGRGEYCVVDLANGDGWLTSRLFIMSIIFARMKGVKAFVFVDSGTAGRMQFVGWATTDKIRWSLARKYSWLENAYAQSYSTVMQGNSYVITDEGKIGQADFPDDPASARYLLELFLKYIQAPVQGMDENQWIKLDSTKMLFEHAAWLNSALVEDILGTNLNREHINQEIRSKKKDELMRIILSMHGKYVAVTSDNLRFEHLIDRHAVLEQVAAKIGE